MWSSSGLFVWFHLLYLLCFAICLNFDKFHDVASLIFLPITLQLLIRYGAAFNKVKSS